MPTEPDLLVSELFFSLQGESTYAGLPCAFIRLAGCNLRCTYCDASYTYQEAGVSYTLEALLDWVATYPGTLVEVTGGEPLLQPAVLPLMRRLLAMGRTVLLETNGSLDIAPLPDGVVAILDIKCPASGSHTTNRLANLALLRPQDELKFVLCDRADYDWARAFLTQHRLLTPLADGRHRPILFSPVTAHLDPAQLAAWILADTLPVRLQLQLHRLLWPEVSRGA